jgi:serine/threonine-protein kinase
MLAAGTRLGPYDIQSLLGAGGMGEVYRALDTRLDRIVAIKILPPDNIATELRERFDREARIVASLSHPHICTLYDVGRQDDVNYLVMELLDGETLAQRLRAGALPVQEALAVGLEIVDALAAAHRAGVIHRDLKPGNIMLTSAGAKLLDFGLAKRRTIVDDGTRSTVPTMTASDTQRGTVLGTVQYMAPEQLEGREADTRTDIFAFGAILYEMLTGRRAFDGPPLALSPALDRLVMKCLAKEPARRWQTAADLEDELRWVGQTGDRAPSPVGRRSASSVWRNRVAGGTAVLLIAAVAAWRWTRSDADPAPPLTVTRFALTLPPGDQLAAGGVAGGPRVAFAPDGERFAYVAVRGTTQQIFVRAMDSDEGTPVPGTEGGGAPFFSPDGRWLGFVAGGALRKVALTGGSPLTVTREVDGNEVEASWSDAGTIVFTSARGLQEVRDSGGAPRSLMNGGDINRLLAPSLLPGGASALFSTNTSQGSRIEVVTLATGQRRSLSIAGDSPQYVPSGHLVYVQGGTLMAVPFDTERLEVTGSPVAAMQNVLQTPNGRAFYSVSNTGTLVYVAGGEQQARRLVWVNRDGSTQDLPAPPRPYDWPRLSPDGQRVALEIGPQIWLYDLGRGTLNRFTFDGDLNQSPAWTPDGTRIVFNSIADGGRSLFWQRADGGGGREQLSTSASVQVPRSWSPDGQFLAFHEGTQSTLRDIWILRMQDRSAQPYLRTKATEGAPSFSPNGRWLAYVSNESGQPEIYVQAFPGPGGKWQVSDGGGTEPAWSRSGRELFYRDGDRMMIVDTDTENIFAAGKPRTAFEGHFVASNFPLIGIAYDVSPDGRRFLMIRETSPANPVAQINVVLNWQEELKRLAPSPR